MRFSLTWPTVKSITPFSRRYFRISLAMDTHKGVHSLIIRVAIHKVAFNPFYERYE